MQSNAWISKQAVPTHCHDFDGDLLSSADVSEYVLDLNTSFSALTT